MTANLAQAARSNTENNWLEIFCEFLKDCGARGYAYVVIDERWHCRAFTHEEWIGYKQSKGPGSQDEYIPRTGPQSHSHRWSSRDPAIWAIRDEFGISGGAANSHQTFLSREAKKHFPHGEWKTSETEVDEFYVEILLKQMGY